ncbi:MAG: ATP-dependent helicase C-terminal domain-containing protein [Thermoanaerobaculia bacterium]
MPQTPLPIDAHIDAIVAHVRAARTAIIVAPPGSGKTTRIPAALTALGRTILLQPRRVAARALARHIAAERGQTIGEEVGWQIRFERRFSDRTRLLVATEGILTARLQSDPLLSDFNVIVLDEFHERSVHADLALALAREAMRSREDLALVVMSATLEATGLSRYLGDARIFEVASARFPVEISYRPGMGMVQAVRQQLVHASGDLLCFLPGAREIERAQLELTGVDAEVLPLHGSLDVAAQERALLPAARRKIILATNLAETSLTVEGVTDVIDSGLQKTLRFDAETAVDHLDVERVARDSADQRAGRAGRTQPGRAVRLWDARDLLRPQREPEIRRIDLSSTLLDVMAWGGHPMTFPWFEAPPSERIEAALSLLTLLGAVEGRKLTELGKRLRSLPLHPRLARIVLAASGAPEALEICAQLAGASPGESGEIASTARRTLGEGLQGSIDERSLRRALLSGYPDRVAMRREPKSSSLLLSSGTGATLAREIDDGQGDFFVVLEIRGDLVRMARMVDREWLIPTHREVVHRLEDGVVRAYEQQWYGALLLHQQTIAPESAETLRLLASGVVPDPQLLRRVALANLPVDWKELAAQAAVGKTRIDAIDLESCLPWAVRKKLDELAPTSIPLPSGRSARLDYRADGSVLASVKLQELFGLGETPCLGPARTPVTFALLAPNGRPMQVTSDLRSFWDGAYQEVRKELRARYPKHPWPEDPWNAKPTHRTKKRSP